MKMFVAALLASSAVLSITSVQASQYRCVAEKSVGFSYKESSEAWSETIFNTEAKYTLTNKAGVMQVKEVSKAVPLFCESVIKKSGEIVCRMVGGELRINPKSGRFILSLVLGYDESGAGNRKSTPFLEIGRCSSF